MLYYSRSYTRPALNLPRHLLNKMLRLDSKSVNCSVMSAAMRTGIYVSFLSISLFSISLQRYSQLPNHDDFVDDEKLYSTINQT